MTDNKKDAQAKDDTLVNAIGDSKKTAAANKDVIIEKANVAETQAKEYGDIADLVDQYMENYQGYAAPLSRITKGMLLWWRS